MENKKRLIYAEPYEKFLIQYAKDLMEIDAPMIAGAIGTCISKLELQPTVEVVHGEWIDKHEIKSFRHTNIPVVQCSKCGCYFCDIINNHHYMYHYCPNCGAKMDGGKDDD